MPEVVRWNAGVIRGNAEKSETTICWMQRESTYSKTVDYNEVRLTENLGDHITSKCIKKIAK